MKKTLRFETVLSIAAEFVPSLQSVVFPMRVQPEEFAVAASQSPLATLAKQSTVLRAGWAIPVALIDIAAPPQAAGAGSLAVQAAEGLTLTWRGLREGPVRLSSPWIALSPGAIAIADPAASNRYAYQRLRLWRDADSKFRSDLHMQYSDSFAVFYLASSAGAELISVQTNVTGRFDRPVDVKGTPFAVNTRKSLFMLAYFDTTELALLYDDNILIDSLMNCDLACQSGTVDLARDPQCSVRRHAGKQPVSVDLVLTQATCAPAAC